MPLKALLLDFDGLILDTETPEVEAWRTTFREFGKEFPDEIWRQMIGQNIPEAEMLPINALGLKEGAMEVHERTRAARITLIERQPPMPGVHELLALADELCLQLAVVSSSTGQWVQGHLSRIGLLDRFERLITKDGDRPSKPDPTLYRIALSELNVSVHEALAFEDSPRGIQAAKAAGLQVFAVPNPLTATMDLSQADQIFDSLGEPRLLSSIQALALRLDS